MWDRSQINLATFDDVTTWDGWSLIDFEGVVWKLVIMVMWMGR